ncbi:MAG TPA: RdgB/HAM1 family non-canonical purine NTP pyrophosphatase [Oligoflexia bacterium]|nr:RdgB/HAM1 family non-canonical purine NTP pyrophosphatase [Oligoflexia bacterium]
MRPTNMIMLASQNAGKIREYQSLFNKYPEYKLVTVGEITSNASALAQAENGKTYYENAFEKGQLAHLAGKLPTISDDSGLEVDALGGRPGVLSDRYASIEPGYSKSESNVRKLLEELRGVPKDKRTARFVCTLVFFMEGVVVSATGTVEGSILETPRGPNGFGYDPIFLVKDTDLSMAEMALEQKNELSHRARALAALMQQIKEKNLKLVRP